MQKIVARMTALNDVIAVDTKNLGPGYQIGHSFFCPRNGIQPDNDWYRRVMESEIMPLIQEYSFDNEQKVRDQGWHCSRESGREHPIQNVYYLLCYAWDKLAEKDVVAVEAINSTTLVNLFARVLINGTHHLLKRGFDRGYVPQHEWTGRLRGRICFQDAIRRNATLTGRLPCHFDELSYNVLHNRLLKATMRRLIRAPGLEAAECSEGLARLCRLFSDIEDIDPNNRLLRPGAASPQQPVLRFPSQGLRTDPPQPARVREARHQQIHGFRPGQAADGDPVREFRPHVLSRPYRLQGQAGQYQVALDCRGRGLRHRCLPRMQTDISLTSDSRKIIIECKFTPEATQQHYEAVTLRSSHLFQIHAYMENLEGEQADTCEMMLLYPSVDRPLSADYVHKGHRIRIRTINLNQSWQLIHRDLLALLE